MTCTRALLRSAAIFIVSTAAHAAGPATVQYFKTTCGICHGPEGKGTPNLAPALRGNAFLRSSDVRAIADTITRGRAGDQKHYKEFPIPMPPQAISGKQLDDLVAYLRTDLQKK